MLSLLAAIVALGELARRVGLIARFARLGALGKRAGAVVTRRGVSDYSKERATRILSGRMMQASLVAGGALLLVIAPVVLLLLLDSIAPFGVRAAFLDWPSRSLILVVSLTYAVLRWRFGANNLQRG